VARLKQAKRACGSNKVCTDPTVALLRMVAPGSGSQSQYDFLLQHQDLSDLAE